MARFWVLLRAVDAETFLVVVLAPDGNLGKARFLMRRHLADLPAPISRFGPAWPSRRASSPCTVRT